MRVPSELFPVCRLVATVTLHTACRVTHRSRDSITVEAIIRRLFAVFGNPLNLKFKRISTSIYTEIRVQQL